MFCPNCGFKLESSNKFCPECGNPISSTGTENKIEKNETPEQIKPKRKTHKHALAVVLTIVFVIGLVGGGLLLFGDKLFFESEENIITTGYWVKDPNYGWFDDGDDALLFAPINNNETFDGIIMMTTEYILPYIIGEDGTITVFSYGCSLNNSTDSYDWEYSPVFEIMIEESENSNKYLIVKKLFDDGNTMRYDKAAEEDSNDMMISLLFSDWSDYYCKPDSFDEYDNHGFYRWTADKAQRDVTFLWFSRIVEDGCNVDNAVYEYGDEDSGWSCSYIARRYYSVDVDEKCIYIDNVRFDFNDDLTQLYNAEEGIIFYRVTDFHLGKIADTDFPPGEFVESY